MEWLAMLKNVNLDGIEVYAGILNEWNEAYYMTIYAIRTSSKDDFDFVCI